MINNTSHHVPKERKLYGNCQVLSPDGYLMFRCDEKKANWYLSRNLATVIEQYPLTIKLSFEPKGLGNHNKDFGLSVMENKCVNCGSEHYLTKHHVVPICYRKHFPIELKSHNFHDVLSLCRSCHENYERKADVLKEHLAEKYGISTNGLISKFSTLRDSVSHNGIDFEEIQIRKAISNSNLLLRNDLSMVPSSRIEEVKKELTKFLGRDYTIDDLTELSNLKTTTIQQTHGEVVISKINNVQGFIEMWRSHFVEHNECKFMPNNWDIKNKIEIIE
jgi:hypothetical protein